MWMLTVSGTPQMHHELAHDLSIEIWHGSRYGWWLQLWFFIFIDTRAEHLIWLPGLILSHPALMGQSCQSEFACPTVKWLREFCHTQTVCLSQDFPPTHSKPKLPGEPRGQTSNLSDGSLNPSARSAPKVISPKSTPQCIHTWCYSSCNTKW